MILKGIGKKLFWTISWICFSVLGLFVLSNILINRYILVTDCKIVAIQQNISPVEICHTANHSLGTYCVNDTCSEILDIISFNCTSLQFTVQWAFCNVPHKLYFSTVDDNNKMVDYLRQTHLYCSYSQRICYDELMTDTFYQPVNFGLVLVTICIVSCILISGGVLLRYIIYW